MPDHTNHRSTSSKEHTTQWQPPTTRHLRTCHRDTCTELPEAMRLLSMSRSVIYEQIRAGRLRTVKQGRARLVPAQAIDEYVQLLIHESEGHIGAAA